MKEPAPAPEMAAAPVDAAAQDAFAAVQASWGFPAFARDFPRHRELDALVAAYVRGDYATVRVEAPRLAAGGVEDDVKRAAELLRARIEPDRTARTLFALTAALLVFLTVWWVLHDGPQQHGPAPSVPRPAFELVK